MTDAATTETLAGPHGRIAADNERDRFTLELFDRLWKRYRERVEHVATYERVIADAGATFVNDHIAFRTFACQEPTTGIVSLSRVFEALGYRAAGCYDFADKHLNAIHFQHPNREFPKLFISELKTWELSPDAERIVVRQLTGGRDPVSPCKLRDLGGLADSSDARSEELLDAVESIFHELPWSAPELADVEALSAESQYAAWVLVHGYNVNHFTSLINSHGVDALDDVEKTAAALRDAGVPMKPEIEGEPGTKLRQTATAAAVIDAPVLKEGEECEASWTYAYFELAERGEVANPETGERERFEGFLGPQATQLFEMTRTGGSPTSS